MVTAPTADLVPRNRLVMQGYLRSRQQETLALLEDGALADHDRVALTLRTR
jgi:hypothetical protein